jgi:CheY-like chemotaxis protein
MCRDQDRDFTDYALDSGSPGDTIGVGTERNKAEGAAMVRIAVVDDSSDFVELIAQAFAEEGWETRSYYGAEGTFRLLRQVTPDLILLDLRLEEPDGGRQLLELLCLDPLTRDIPLIVCSADLPQLQAGEEQLRACGAAILPKPFDLEELCTLVRRCLHRPAGYPTSTQSAPPGDGKHQAQSR